MHLKPQKWAELYRCVTAVLARANVRSRYFEWLAETRDNYCSRVEEGEKNYLLVIVNGCTVGGE